MTDTTTPLVPDKEIQMKFRTLPRLIAAPLAASLAAVSLAACGSDGGSDAGKDAAVAGAEDTAAPLYDELPEAVRKAGKLVVGSQLASPPVTFLKDDGKTIDGVNADLAAELSEELGVPIEFQQISFASLTPSLQSGKIDAAFDMMSDNPERRETFDFVDYLHNGLTYLVKKDNPEGIESVKDLCGASVAGVRGTSLVTYAEEASAACETDSKDAIEVRQFANANDARLQVQNGKSVAFLGQTPIMLYLAKTANDGNLFSAVTDPDYKVETLGITVAKDDTALRDVLQKALQSLIDNGDYAKVLDGYGLSELALDEATVNAGQ